tara:strand:- start:1856 stop:2251 length:396 start_codon:yes stop_codon:yes gene_type:complete
MFSIEQLQGILLSIAKPEVHISRADNLQIGYRVRVRVNIRGSKAFLSAVNRSLLQQSVTTKYKDKEHKSRPRPILTIGGLQNIWKLCQVVPNLPDAKKTWVDFKEIVAILDAGEHHTLEGLERILQIKGEI